MLSAPDRVPSLTSPLGSPTAVAAAAIGEFRKRRFSTRQPNSFVRCNPPLFALVGSLPCSCSCWASSRHLVPTSIWRRFTVADRLPSCLTGTFVLASTRVGRRLAVSSGRSEQQLAGSGRWQPASSWLWSAAPRCYGEDDEISTGTATARGYCPASSSMATRYDVWLRLQHTPAPMGGWCIQLAICGLFAWRQYSQRRQHVLAGWHKLILEMARVRAAKRLPLRHAFTNHFLYMVIGHDDCHAIVSSLLAFCATNSAKDYKPQVCSQGWAYRGARCTRPFPPRPWRPSRSSTGR